MKVVSALTDNKVALWDRDPRHPDGEVWVVGDRVVEVGLTSAVRKALKQGRIVEVEEAVAEPQTVDEILAAVEAEEISPQDALAAEQAGRGRVTLIRALEGMLEPESEDAGDGSGDGEAAKEEDHAASD